MNEEKYLMMDNYIEKPRNVVLTNLPNGFEELISYGMINYVVPLSRYPRGYHVKKMSHCLFLQ